MCLPITAHAQLQGPLTHYLSTFRVEKALFERLACSTVRETELNVENEVYPGLKVKCTQCTKAITEGKALHTAPMHR